MNEQALETIKLGFTKLGLAILAWYKNPAVDIIYKIGTPILLFLFIWVFLLRGNHAMDVQKQMTTVLVVLLGAGILILGYFYALDQQWIQGIL